MLKSYGFACLVVLTLFAVEQSSAQGPYQVVTVVNGGTVAGVVKWSGPLPHLLPFPVTKDQQICDPDSRKSVDLERLIVGPQNGVANTIIYLKDISSGKAMDLPEQRRFLDQKHCRYEPHILLVPQDETLKIKSSDATLHTVHMDGAASFNLPFPFVDQVNSREMHAPGLVNVRCNGGHIWMNAEMMVVPHPYYVVTDATGKFELTNVPSGTYQLVAWHEGWAVTRKETTIDVLSQQHVQRPIFTPPKTWEKGISVNPNQVTTINFVLTDKAY